MKVKQIIRNGLVMMTGTKSINLTCIIHFPVAPRGLNYQAKDFLLPSLHLDVSGVLKMVVAHNLPFMLEAIK